MRLQHSRATIGGLSVLMLLALGVRVWGLERYGLWIDELVTARCLILPLIDVPTLNCMAMVDQSPFSYLITHLVYGAFGRPPLPVGEWMVRLPALVAGTFNVLAAWLVGRELFGMRGAWLYGLLWALLPTAVAYSQEARPYAWLALLSNLSTWFLLRALSRGSLAYGAAFGVAAALNFYNSYLAAFVILAQLLFAGIFLLYRARRDETWKPPLRGLVVGVLLCGVLIVPWLPSTWQAVQFLLTSGHHDVVRLTPNQLWDAQSWVVFNVTEAPWLALVLALASVVGLVWMGRHARRAFVLSLCWLGILLLFLAWRQAGFKTIRYWLVVEPAVYLCLTGALLAAAGWLEGLLARRGRIVSARKVTVGAACIVALLALPGLANYYRAPYQDWRFDDWRGAARYLGGHAKPGELVMAFGDGSLYHKMALEYYLPSGTVRGVYQPHEIDGHAVADAQRTTGRAWGIVYTDDADAVERLRAEGGDTVEVRTFDGLALVSPRSEPPETVAASARRLVELYEHRDPEHFAFARAILWDDGAHENLLRNPQLEARKKGAPRDWKTGTSRVRVIATDAVPALALTSDTLDGSGTAQQQLELAAERLYVLRYECKNTLTNGAQRTYVTFDRTDNGLIVFPNGAGDVCHNTVDWEEHAFVVRAPSPAQAGLTATVLLGNTGTGEALWRNIALYEIP